MEENSPGIINYKDTCCLQEPGTQKGWRPAAYSRDCRRHIPTHPLRASPDTYRDHRLKHDDELDKPLLWSDLFLHNSH